jgi:DNA (cytosine-5)-methyltransferase 1
MSKQILIRNVPEHVAAWIDRSRASQRLTQQEFVLEVLQTAATSDTMPLFLQPTPEKPNPVVTSLPFKFVDLFAGIGGFRIALEKFGGRCVFTSEWDKYSQRTYKAWHGDMPHGDIRKITPSDIPDHDILAAGFPCQPFSIAGVSKRQSLGMAHGFKCVTQGNLFFQLATIIEHKKPAVLFLENVKNLQSHDCGRTWAVIKHKLENDLKYWVFSKVIDAADYVPQHRERIYIVCFDRRVFRQPPAFEFPGKPNGARPKLREILDPNPDAKYTLTEHLWNYLQKYAEHHKAKGNGFGFGLADLDGVARTLSARYYKDGSEILIPQGAGKPPRRLTPQECGRLMGFDKQYHDRIAVSDTQAYKQFGNAVVPKVVEAVAGQIIQVVGDKLLQRNGCLLRPAASR